MAAGARSDTSHRRRAQLTAGIATMALALSAALTPGAIAASRHEQQPGRVPPRGEQPAAPAEPVASAPAPAAVAPGSPPAAEEPGSQTPAATRGRRERSAQGARHAGAGSHHGETGASTRARRGAQAGTGRRAGTGTGTGAGASAARGSAPGGESARGEGSVSGAALSGSARRRHGAKGAHAGGKAVARTPTRTASRGSGSSGSAPAAASASASAVSAPSATAQQATFSAATSASQAPAPGLSAVPVKVSSKHRSHATGTGATQGAVLAAAPAGESARAAAGTGEAAPAQAGSKRAAGSHATKGSSSSPIATTVTKIIDVVPASMRLIIAALAALALAFGVSSRIAAMRARRLARQRAELLEDVGLLQAALLPELPDRLGPVATSVAYTPASGPGAGGDFYDVFALEDGEIAVIVGDVSGHGRDALPHTTLLRFTLRAYLESGLSPRAALQAATPVLERQLGGSFATVVLATYNPRERTLVYSCAGHPPPLLAGAGRVNAITAGSSPPIGAGRPTGRRQTVVSVPGRAVACFFTDGVVEARKGGALFGLARLHDTLAQLGPEANAEDLLERVAQLSDAQPDDMATCVLRIEGDALDPEVSMEEFEVERSDLVRGRAERFMRAAGVPGREIGETLVELRTALSRRDGAVLELHMTREAPAVLVRSSNVSVLGSQGRRIANVG